MFKLKLKIITFLKGGIWNKFWKECIKCTYLQMLVCMLCTASGNYTLFRDPFLCTISPWNRFWLGQTQPQNLASLSCQLVNVNTEFKICIYVYNLFPHTHTISHMKFLRWFISHCHQTAVPHYKNSKIRCNKWYQNLTWGTASVTSAQCRHAVTINGRKLKTQTCGALWLHFH
jgi:hypothetical protein